MGPWGLMRAHRVHKATIGPYAPTWALKTLIWAYLGLVWATRDRNYVEGCCWARCLFCSHSHWCLLVASAASVDPVSKAQTHGQHKLIRAYKGFNRAHNGPGGLSFFTTRVNKNDEEALRPAIIMSSRPAPLLSTGTHDIGAGGPFLTKIDLLGNFPTCFSVLFLLLKIVKQMNNLLPEGRSTPPGISSPHRMVENMLSPDYPKRPHSYPIIWGPI